MIENAQKGRLGEIVEAEQNIIVLSAELAKYKAIAHKWEVEFDTKIEVDNGRVTLTVTAHTGQSSVSAQISQESVEYYLGDHASFARQLARKMISDLLADEVDALLVPKLEKAFRNVMQVKGTQ